MTMDHEALPRGIPAAWPGLKGPLVQRQAPFGQNDRFVIPWGALYESTVGNPSQNTRVELRDLSLYVLSKSTGTWQKLVLSTSPAGEGRKGLARAPYTDVRKESSGTISIRAGKDGYHFEFWAQGGRVTIDPSDVAGVFSTFQARLILDDPSKPDDRGTSQYIAAAGADLWPSATDLNAPQQGNDIGAGRFKYVVNDWRPFNMATVSAAELRRNPPPFSDPSIPSPPPIGMGGGNGGIDASIAEQAALAAAAAPPASDNGSGGSGSGSGNGAGADLSATNLASAVEMIISDMKLYHDGPTAVLESLPGWGSGVQWPAATRRPDGWQYAIPWTHVMADTSSPNGNGYPWLVPGPYTGNQAPNTRIQQRDVQMWWLLSNGTWRLGSHNNSMEPVLYPLHWAEGTSEYGTDVWRDESGNGGGVSMRSIGREKYARHLWHTWAAPNPIPDDAVGVVTVFFARRILDNPFGPDDRRFARILAAGAGDWYKDTATLSSPKVGGEPGDPGVNVTYMGFSRLKYVTNDWQLFGWTSLSESQLRSNPPPIIGIR
jgi:hypothetical protein